MITCKDVCNGASDFLDGSLNREDREVIERHLDSCAACRNLYQTLKRTIECTRSVVVQEPPPALIEAMVLGIREKLKSA